jgi:hypothetical protein
MNTVTFKGFREHYVDSLFRVDPDAHDHEMFDSDTAEQIVAGIIHCLEHSPSTVKVQEVLTFYKILATEFELATENDRRWGNKENDIEFDQWTFFSGDNGLLSSISLCIGHNRLNLTIMKNGDRFFQWTTYL